MSIPKIQNEKLLKFFNFFKQPKIRWILRVTGYLLVVVGFTIIIILTIFSSGRPLNSKLFAITSGSMRPKIPMGSIVLVKPQNNYRVGDIIVFQDDQRLVTHRISSKLPDDLLQTKGDANNEADRFQISKDQIIGRVIFTIPRLGRLLMLLQTRAGIILLVVLPGAILIWQEILLAYKHMTYKSYAT